MSAIQDQLEELRQSFTRLSQREQLMVVGAGVALAFFILSMIGLWVGGLISTAERRVRVKTEQLSQLVQLQGEYRARIAEREALLRELRRTNIRLVSVVEDAARQSGVNIGQLSPEEDEPNSEGIAESRVDLRATELSIDRLEDFLKRIEASKGMVVVRRMRVHKPFRKDTVNVEMTVATYKVKS